MPMDQLKGIFGVAPTSNQPKKQSGGGGLFHHEEPAKEHTGKEDEESFSVETSFMGVPAQELTPAVEAALSRLMAEIDHLRTKLSQVQEHEKRLLSQIDQHPLAPILNRKAFEREVARILAYEELAQMTCTFAYLKIENFEKIQRTHGIHAAEASFIAASGMMLHALRATDMVGAISDNSFGIVLALADRTAAEQKIEQLIKILETQSVVWDGVLLKLNIRYGLYVMEASDDVETVVRRADRDLHTKTDA